MRACVVIQMFCEFQTLSRTQAGSRSRSPLGGVPCLAGGAVKIWCHIYPGGPFGSPFLWQVGRQIGTCNELSPHRLHYKLRSFCLGSKGSGPVDWPCHSEVIWGSELEMWLWLVLGTEYLRVLGWYRLKKSFSHLSSEQWWEILTLNFERSSALQINQVFFTQYRLPLYSR